MENRIIKQIKLFYQTDNKEFVIYANKKNGVIDFTFNENFDCRINFLDSIILSALRLEIDFSEAPIFWRNHDYTWVDFSRKRVSNDISPKILRFSSGNYLMSNKYFGVWEISCQNPKKLIWHIYGSKLSPFFYFDEQGKRNWLDVTKQFEAVISLKLFYSKKAPVEISRSKIPFSPVIIFTDHCDFDSDLLLVKQREFFKENNIRVTKGFFLNHFSKKGDWNASFERNKEEFHKWHDDGHELCYHSLSQSTIWDDRERNDQFKEFKSPDKIKVETWIDHGYQPYNFSKTSTYEDRENWLIHLNNKGIKLVWNYNDIGEGVFNLNQNNSESFNFRNIIFSNVSTKDKIRLVIFYFGNEDILLEYRKISSIFQKSSGLLKKIVPLLNTLKLLFKLSLKKNRYKYSKYPQLFFGTNMDKVLAFQTVVVKDWCLSLGKPLNKLIKESGVGILHTYFAFLGKHHGNPLFINENGVISENVKTSFQKLGRLILSDKIWNPTLIDFLKYYQILLNAEIVDTEIDFDVIGIKKRNWRIIHEN